jgi:hypothetical protein
MGWTLKRSANYISAHLHTPKSRGSCGYGAGTRLRGKDANSACPHRREIEDIRHMTYDCMVAAYIRDIVFTEWWALTTDSKWVMRSTFKSAFFNKDNTTMAVAARTLNDIATFHIWKDRCNVLYGRDITPSVITANNIWVEFTSTIRARLNHIKAKANWWTYSDAVRLVPKTIAEQNLDDIEVEQSILLTLLPDWECPGTS